MKVSPEFSSSVCLSSFISSWDTVATKMSSTYRTYFMGLGILVLNIFEVEYVVF